MKTLNAQKVDADDAEISSSEFFTISTTASSGHDHGHSHDEDSADSLRRLSRSTSQNSFNEHNEIQGFNSFNSSQGGYLEVMGEDPEDLDL